MTRQPGCDVNQGTSFFNRYVKPFSDEQSGHSSMQLECLKAVSFEKFTIYNQSPNSYALRECVWVHLLKAEMIQARGRAPRPQPTALLLWTHVMVTREQVWANVKIRLIWRLVWNVSCCILRLRMTCFVKSSSDAWLRQHWQSTVEGKLVISGRKMLYKCVSYVSLRNLYTCLNSWLMLHTSVFFQPCIFWALA